VEYTLLTHDDRRAIAEKRLQTLEAEHYASSLALRAAEAIAASSVAEDHDKAAAVAERERLKATVALLEVAHAEAVSAISQLASRDAVVGT